MGWYNVAGLLQCIPLESHISEHHHKLLVISEVL